MSKQPKALVRRKKWFSKYKKTCRCSICGIRNEFVLDFHHIGEKKNHISTMVHKGVKLRSLIEELMQTVPVCANCHRIIHAKQKGYC